MQHVERIGPESEKQELFINSDADITVFGGGAGSGKTYVGIMDFLRYVEDPYFTGVITRRTTPQLAGPGGPLEKCLQLFKALYPKVRWQEKKGRFVFPSGAYVYLRHFEYEDSKEDFTGWEVTKFLIDEGQQYTETMVVFLLSRMRNPKCKVRPHMKITCNPDKESFLRQWLSWFINEDGLPDPERTKQKRWFVRIDNKMHWGNSKEECITLYGKADLPAEHPKQVKPLSLAFIPATVYDNPPLMRADPQYVANLEALGRVERQRLLHGNWDVTEESTGYFKREWLGDPLPQVPMHGVIKRIRAWDFAGSLPSETNPNPDWTVGVRMSKLKDGRYVIEDVIRFRARFGEVLERVIQVAKDDGEDVTIITPREPGQAGQHASAYFIRELAEAGFYAKSFPTNQSKITRFAPFCATAETKIISYVVGDWNDSYFTELENFDGSRNKKDD
jgi:predicted phage terminase large subunit-like protein